MSLPAHGANGLCLLAVLPITFALALFSPTVINVFQGRGKERIKALWDLSLKSIRSWLFLPPDALFLRMKSFIFCQFGGN